MRRRADQAVVVYCDRGNSDRLLTVIDDPMSLVRVVDGLTHAEYDKDAWKDRF